MINKNVAVLVSLECGLSKHVCNVVRPNIHIASFRRQSNGRISVEIEEHVFDYLVSGEYLLSTKYAFLHTK